MKTIQKIAIATLFILPIKTSYATTAVAPLLQYRSQGQDIARELAGMTQQVNLFNKNDMYGTLALTTEYTRSFRPQRIAQELFGREFCNKNCSGALINVSGSRVANRGANDWLADNFYLPTDFQSTLKFTPRIANVVVDINGYIGLDNIAQGLFIRLDAPLAWTNWNLNFCEVFTSTGSNATDDGYMSCAPMPRSQLLNNFSNFAHGLAPAQFIDVDFPGENITFDGLCNAKIEHCSRSLTRLADLSLILGYNFLDCEKYHFGAGAKVIAPTGNRPEGKYLFEPIIGNGKHWELGAYLTGHAMLWECQDEDASFGLYIDATITHLFNTRQRRTADLNNRPLSRYMLAEKFSSTVTGLSGGTTAPGSIIPTAQFAREFSPIANLTTQDVNVSIGVQGDIAAQFTYVQGGWNWDLGYNFWGRSCEKISSCKNTCASSSSCPNTCSSSNACNATFAENTWGVKGDAYVFGFPVVDQAFGCTPLSATENSATINAGTNFAATGASSTTLVAAGQTNPGVDNKQLAWTGVGGTEIFDTNAVSQINTSINPILIKKEDFNFGGTRGYSHKLYTHVNYQWLDVACVSPYVGLGGFGEFGSNGSCKSSCPSTFANNNCSSSCSSSSCTNAALSQWGVWAKLGVSFN